MKSYLCIILEGLNNIILYLHMFQFKAIGVLVGSCLHQKQKNAHYNVVPVHKLPQCPNNFCCD